MGKYKYYYYFFFVFFATFLEVAFLATAFLGAAFFLVAFLVAIRILGEINNSSNYHHFYPKINTR